MSRASRSVALTTYKSALELRGRVHLIGALFEQGQACIERGLVVRSLVEGVAVELDLQRGRGQCGGATVRDT